MKIGQISIAFMLLFPEVALAQNNALFSGEDALSDPGFSIPISDFAESGTAAADQIETIHAEPTPTSLPGFEPTITISEADEALTVESIAPAPTEVIEKQLIPFKDLPDDRRVELVRKHQWSPEDPTVITYRSRVSPETEVQIGKPWLAKPLAGFPKSAPGYCPMKISYGTRQIRQEERPNTPWPYPHTEVVQEGDIQLEKTSIRNLGNFYALLDPKHGTYAALERTASMRWRENITQADIDRLCNDATKRPWLYFQKSTEVDPITLQIRAKDIITEGPTFLDHRPSDVKNECPGGGRDTFAATYGTYFVVEKIVTKVRDQGGKELPEFAASDLICRALSQVCCFDSEAPWPLHSFYPGESGKGYDNPDPDFSPSQEEQETLGKINYAYSFLGSKGLSTSHLLAEELILPSAIGEKDPWLKRLSPVLQPPRGEIPTKEKITTKEVEFTVVHPRPEPTP